MAEPTAIDLRVQIHRWNKISTEIESFVFFVAADLNFCAKRGRKLRIWSWIKRKVYKQAAVSKGIQELIEHEARSSVK
jgi:hypothetical protein